MVNNLVSNDLGNILDKLVIFGTKRRYQSVEEVLKDLSQKSTTPAQISVSIQPVVTKPISSPVQPAVTKPVPTIIQPVQVATPKNIIIPKVVGTYTEILTKKTITIQKTFFGKKEFESLEEVELEMVILPAGNFMMGSDEEDTEKPKHQVALKQFAIGKYPVTEGQYQVVMGYSPSAYKNNPRCVDWNYTQIFCQKLNEKTGKKYRLPSEAEWEYACRAGTQTRYYFGDNKEQLSEYAWYYQNSGHQTNPVGQKKPNNWGLFDMSGNVWEWCDDGWHNNYQNAPKNGSSWNDNHSQSTARVVRGGGYNSDNSSRDVFRSASRRHTDADSCHGWTGFRLALSLP